MRQNELTTAADGAQKLLWIVFVVSKEKGDKEEDFKRF